VFGIGWTEFLVIALVLLIFVGPRNLPPLFQKFGKVMADLKSASRELRNQLETEVGDIESPQKIVRDIARDVLEKAALPYEEAEQADRELRQAAQALKRDVVEIEKPSSEATDKEMS